MPDLRLVGSTDYRVFGVTAGERLKRQVARLHVARGGAVAGGFVARADTVVLETTLEWLCRHPRCFLHNDRGEPVICFVEGTGDSPDLERAVRAIVEGVMPEGFRAQDAAGITVFSKTLRTRKQLIVLSLADAVTLKTERILFRHVYKGVTDVVTRYVWPLPAFWLTRACTYAGIHANVITLTSIVLAFAAAFAFADGEWLWGLAAAWLVTFLDTVDGKVARVTATTSRFGDKLDHISDLIHPPMWWICVAIGTGQTLDNDLPSDIGLCTNAILTSYLGGRISEKRFKKRFGFNQYLWRPFDAYLRGVIARRNTILLVLTAGALCSRMSDAIRVVAVWCILSIGLQVTRWIYAEWLALSGQPVQSWLQADT